MQKTNFHPSTKRGVVYQIQCKTCKMIYWTNPTASCKKHKRALRLMDTNLSAVAHHAIEKNHEIDWEMQQ